MKWICITLILFLPFQHSFSQSKRKVFTAQVRMMDGARIKGMLYRVNESSIVLATKEIRTDTVFHTAFIQDIKTLKVRRKGSFSMSVALGIAVGALIGYSTYTNPCYPDDLFCLDFGPEYPAGIGAGVGAIVGVVVGIAMEKNFKIDSKQERYNEMKSSLKPLALIKN